MENCSNMFIGNLLKLNADELKQLLIAAWFGIQQNVVDQAMTNGEFTLMHVSKPKESILITYYVVLFHNCQ